MNHTHTTPLTAAALAATVLLPAAVANAESIDLRITVRNIAPDDGVRLTPTWIGFHDGTFDSYDGGSPSSPELERIIEDGNTGPFNELFDASGAGAAQATMAADLGIPVIEPGETASMIIRVDAASPMARYFSYVSMIVPSNDAYVANGNPTAHPVFTADGAFIPTTFQIMGSAINDGGTEVNDELPENTAFFGQMTPDTGVDENGVNVDHPGFLPVGSGGILDDPRFAGADFTAAGYAVAEVTIEQVELVRLRVEVSNRAPVLGTALTPTWIAFHDGVFDTYDGGSPSTPEFERLVEDGNTGPLSDLFNFTSTGVDATLASDSGIPVIQFEETATFEIELDPMDPRVRYFSYASMIVPSNDAYVANGNPLAHRIFDADGNFLGAEFDIFGDEVGDAGTEVNDEVPANTAFFGQMAPDTGVDENGVNTAHPGFLAIENGGILATPAFQNADFTQDGYRIARIRVSLAGGCRTDIFGGDGVTGFGDLLTLISNFGTDRTGAELAFPFDTVDMADLLYLLSEYGPCGG
ncbi:MAG: spondin domain-containing protein [Phycisphaerales bacterium]